MHAVRGGEPSLLWLPAAQHLLKALASEPEPLRGAGLRSALAQRVLDHAALQRLDRLVERAERWRGARAGRDSLGEMSGAERMTVVAEGHRALDLVRELAHVARPRIGAEELERFGGDRGHGPPRAPARLAEEIVGEGGNVLGAVAKGRQADGEDVEPVVEITAKAANGYVGLEIGVGGGDDADVHATSASASDPSHLALLEHAEEALLHGGRRLAHLVEEDGASVGLLEETLALASGAREGAPGVAEQLGLEERVGKRATALGHERLVATRSVDVDEEGEELLARARLPEEEDSRVSVEDLARELDGRTKPTLGADEAIEGRGFVAPRRRLPSERVVGQLELVAEPRVLAGEAPALGGAPYDHQELVGVPGLGDEVVDPPRVDRLHEVVDVGVGGQHDPHRVRLLLAPAQELDARHPRHAVVGHDDRHVRLGRETGEGLLPVAGPDHPKLGGQDGLQRVEHARLVVHDQDRRLVHEASRRAGGQRADHPAVAGPDARARTMGSRSVNSAPPAGRLWARISPPCFLTIS